jgi:hypothetical protein
MCSRHSAGVVLQQPRNFRPAIAVISESSRFVSASLQVAGNSGNSSWKSQAWLSALAIRPSEMHRVQIVCLSDAMNRNVRDTKQEQQERSVVEKMRWIASDIETFGSGRSVDDWTSQNQ